MIRLLVVAYYFPPAGGAGVQRVLKWVKYLRDFGIEPVVVTVRAGAYPKHDETLVRDVPEGVEVYRSRALDPFGTYARLTGRTRQAAVAEQLQNAPDGFGERLARWVRANVVLPDARVGWVPFAIRTAKRLHRERPFDAVLTSGPPHSAHLVGRALRRAGLPWIADFRDPWTDIHYYDRLPRTRLARRVDEALERSVLRAADAVTVVSPRWAALLASKLVGGAERITVIHSGFDAEDFEGVEASPRRDRFVVTHVGTLYGTPDALWEAATRVRADAPRLCLRLVGHVPSVVRDAIHRYGLEDLVEIEAYVPHDAAVREMLRATLLILTLEEWPHAEGLITGKLYEYLASGRPVLGLGPIGGDAAALLAATGAGRMFDRNDVVAIAAYLQEMYAAWDAGEIPAGADPRAVAPYTRRAQTADLADLIRRVVSP